MSVECACVIRLTGKVLLCYLNVSFWCEVFLLFIFFFPTPSDGEGYSEILFATSPVMHTVRPTFYKGIVFLFYHYHSNREKILQRVCSWGISGPFCDKWRKGSCVPNFLPPFFPTISCCPENVLVFQLSAFYSLMNSVFWDFGN